MTNEQIDKTMEFIGFILKQYNYEKLNSYNNEFGDLLKQLYEIPFPAPKQLK